MSNAVYLLGCDVGSSSVKAAIVDAHTGQCVASAFYPPTEAPIKALQPGWAEQNPADWWEYLKQAVRAALDKAGIEGCDIKAIGISYQMHGLVMVDKGLQPIRDAIIWCDSRGVPYGERAFNALGHDRCLGSLLNSPGNFTAAKLQWVKENEPENYDRIYKIMLPGDYIAMRLTGDVYTTAEGLSECMLWDFSTDAPAEFLLDFYGYDAEMLPEVVPSFSLQGGLTSAAAAELCLAPGTPVAYRAGDQPNNALSLGVFNPGEIASTAGTSGVVYGINGAAVSDPLSRVNNFAHVNHAPGYTRIGVLACINGTGILNSWMRRNVAPEASYQQINEIAAQAPVGSRGLAVLPFGNGAERLLENRQIGCSLHGLNFNVHGRAHLLRAAQEGIVFAFMYGIEIMKGMGMEVNRIHAGNANMMLSPIFRDTLASVSGSEIALYDTDGAVGAAKGAGIGASIYHSFDEAFESLRLITTVAPAADPSPYLEAYYNWRNILDHEH